MRLASSSGTVASLRLILFMILVVGPLACGVPRARASAWVQLSQSGPSARDGACAVYDPIRKRAILFGGASGSTLKNDVWAFNLDCATPSWSQLTTGGSSVPAGREHASAVYDWANDQMLVFGGSTSGGLSNELWALPLSGANALTWQQINVSGGPCAREGQGVAYDPVLHQMLIFGGDDGGIEERQDTWAYTTTVGTWTTVAPTDPSWCGFKCPIPLSPQCRELSTSQFPGFRRWMGSLFDDSHMLVLSGWYDNTILAYDDAYSLDASAGTWSQLAPTGTSPGPIFYHTAVYDAGNNRALVFDGETVDPIGNFNMVNGVWQLTLGTSPAWTQLQPSGTVPSAREGHVAIFDPVGRRMVTFGGETVSGQQFGDTWALDFDTTPPAAVTDLDFKAVTSSSVTLKWTAPGDDSLTGQACRYDIRESTSPITDANFSSASSLTGPTPSTAGATDTLKVAGLSSGVFYYFALKTVDKSGNWSGLSNVFCIKLGRIFELCSGNGASLQPVSAATPPGFGIEYVRPVPARGSFNVGYSLSADSPASLELIDVAGRVLVRQELAARQGEQIASVMVPRVRGPQMLFVRLRQGSSLESRSVIAMP